MMTKFTRRDFVRGIPAVLFATALGSSASAQSRSGNRTLETTSPLPADSLGFLVLDDFVPFIGETFRAVTSSGRGVQLRLAFAESAGQSSEWRNRYAGSAYSLTFEGARNSKLAQDVYSFEHYALGNFSLLLVPVGLTGRRFEALINRTHE